MARAIYNELLSTAWLRQHLPKLKPNEENNFTDVAIKLLPEFFLSLLENSDISRTQQVIQEANINIRDYIPKGKESDEQIDEWLKSTKLDKLFFLYASTKNLEEIILKGTEPEQIGTWIKVSFLSFLNIEMPKKSIIKCSIVLLTNVVVGTHSLRISKTRHIPPNVD